MIRSKEATGKTVEEARAAACAALGVSEDDLNVSYEVLEMPQSTGFLGLKKIPAKVRVIVEEEDPAPAAPEKPAVKVVRAEKAQPAEPAEKAEKAQPAPAPQPAEKPAPQPAPAVDDRPPEYTRGDIADALEREQSFYGLSQEMERLLGRVFSDTDLKSLYTIYDYLALPVEVIFMLAGYVVRSSRRQKGDASPLPRMTEVKREAFRWKRLGITTVERAEEYLRDQESIDQREWGVLSAVGVTQKRPAIDKEREYIHRWVQWGFSDEMIHLAYERTIYRKGQMNWPYVNKILESWKKSGYTTPQQVEQERGGQTRKAQPQTQGARPQENYQPSASRIQQQADWLDQFLQEQEKGGN